MLWLLSFLSSRVSVLVSFVSSFFYSTQTFTIPPKLSKSVENDAALVEAVKAVQEQRATEVENLKNIRGKIDGVSAGVSKALVAAARGSHASSRRRRSSGSERLLDQVTKNHVRTATSSTIDMGSLYGQPKTRSLLEELSSLKEFAAKMKSRNPSISFRNSPRPRKISDSDFRADLDLASGENGGLNFALRLHQRSATMPAVFDVAHLNTDNERDKVRFDDDDEDEGGDEQNGDMFAFGNGTDGTRAVAIGATKSKKDYDGEDDDEEEEGDIRFDDDDDTGAGTSAHPPLSSVSVSSSSKFPGLSLPTPLTSHSFTNSSLPTVSPGDGLDDFADFPDDTPAAASSPNKDNAKYSPGARISQKHVNHHPQKVSSPREKWNGPVNEQHIHARALSSVDDTVAGVSGPDVDELVRQYAHLSALAYSRKFSNVSASHHSW
eukprot:ANDGO_00421.mRNA.1 hypothetical protein